VPFDPTNVGGTLQISTSSPQTKLVQLELSATLTAEGMTGSLAGIEQTTSGSGPNSAVSARDAVLAAWPDSEACRPFFQDGAGLGVRVQDEALGFTGDATIASLVPEAAQPITWLNGEQTTLSIEIAADGDGCFRVRDQLPPDLGGGPSVRYPVTISLKSADGRLDGSYPGMVVATGSGAARNVTAETVLELAVDQAPQSGFSGVEVPSSADSLRFRVETSLEGGTSMGTVQLVALTGPDCTPDKPTPLPGDSSQGASSPGCAGQTQTPIESASWSH
jgi:hypothetical protein